MPRPFVRQVMPHTQRFQFATQYTDPDESADEADIMHGSSSTPFDDDYFATDSKLIYIMLYNQCVW